LEDVVYVLNSTKSLGVKAKGGGGLELDETSLEVEFDGLGGPAFPSSDLFVRKGRQRGKR
jgi:hypothetical protein